MEFRANLRQPQNKNELAAFLASSDHETDGAKSMTERIGYKLETWKEMARKRNQKNVERWLNQHSKNTEQEFAKLSDIDQLNMGLY